MADPLLPESVRDKFPRLSLKHVLLLQAHIRGIIVRSHMRSVREEFINVFNEIQPKDNLRVSWKSQFLCLPSFTTAKKEEPKCLGLNLKAVQNPEGQKEIITSEKNFSITKEDQKILCSPFDQIFNEDRPSIVSPQLPVNTSNKPVRKDVNTDSQNLFSDDRKESEISKLENERIHHLPVSKEETLANPIALEQDSQSVKSFDSSDESQQKDSKTTFTKQEHCQCQALSENGICNLGDDKDICSHEPNNDGKNIESTVTNSSLCSKLSEKDDRSETQTLDSTLTDVTSVWDSVHSISPGVSDTSCPETIASLQLQKQNIALELVWLQQAILSRKNYLRLKRQMDS